MTGNAYSSHPLSSPQGILDLVASDSGMSVVGSKSGHTPMPHSAVGASKPSLDDSPNFNTIQAPALYFVTELDSPKGDSSSPNFVSQSFEPILPLSLSPALPNNQNPSKISHQTSSPIQVHLSLTISKPKSLTLSSPNTTHTTISPLKLTLPDIPVSSLSAVFDYLTIKRKAQDELSDFKKSKILHLCSPDRP